MTHYTLTAVIDAESLGDALERARYVTPKGLTPEDLAWAADEGLIKFTITGGGQIINLDLSKTNIPLFPHAAGGFTPRGTAVGITNVGAP